MIEDENYESNENEDHKDLVHEAIIEFQFAFCDYVKQMDIDMWKRAVDYAKTFTKVEGVSFEYDKE
jgi:hypothetical protein